MYNEDVDDELLLIIFCVRMKRNYAQPERVYSISLIGNRVVVATAGRHVNVYDLRNMSQPEQRRESSLKYQTRCVRCCPNGTGYALSSMEGHVVMEFFELTEAGQSKKYAFKCHRKSEAGRDIVYPVNAISFHLVHEPDAIFVSSVNEVEVKPNPKS
ncbi:mitotic checkpoint protein BUB3.1 [Tanacetum coccineum]